MTASKGSNEILPLVFLGWFVFALASIHLIQEIQRNEGWQHLWDLSLFLSLLSYQFCLRKGAKRFYQFFSNRGFSVEYMVFVGFIMGFLIWGASTEFWTFDLMARIKPRTPPFNAWSTIHGVLTLLPGICVFSAGSLLPFQDLSND